MRYNDGFIRGTGAARNIELGFVPSWVRLINLTDADMIFEGPVAEAIAFDGGGNTAHDTREIKAGDMIHASDDGWHGTVKQVILSTGSWAAGTAAGWIVFEGGTLEGVSSIADNDTIYVRPQAGAKGSADAATVNGAGLTTVTVQLDPTNTTDANKMDPAGTNEHIKPYYGAEGSKARGFTLESAVCESAKLLAFQAWAPDPGSAPPDMSKG